MKATKAEKNKEHVTALFANVELTTYAANGEQRHRRSVPIGYIEEVIPHVVRSWLLRAARETEKAKAAAPKEG